MRDHCVAPTTSELSFEVRFVQDLCITIGTPRALTVYLLLKYGEYQQLVDLSLDPSKYDDVSNFADDYIVTEVLKKSPNLPLGIDRKQVAVDSFYESETACRRTNLMVQNELANGKSVPYWYKGYRDRVHRLLGRLTRSDLHYCSNSFRFGPGATTAVRGTGSVLSDKYDAEMHLTRDLYPFYKAILGDRWWEHLRKPSIVNGNRFTTVPHSATKDRGICVEPTLNVYVQLGIGSLIRKRLKRVGLNLDKQWEVNRALASVSQELNLCTLDLSRASDSISYMLVRDLLPRDWFHLLDICRSRYTSIEGNLVELEKFSSMGNGYTFELETMLFYCLALEFVPRRDQGLVTVFGDDIIIPRYAASPLIEALSHLGFSVNAKKSFLAGSFFESCGTDWFNGQPVRPFFLKGSGSLIPYRVQVANKLRLYAEMRGCLGYCDSRFRRLWASLYKRSPTVWKKCLVTKDLGDQGFIVSDEELPSRSKGLNTIEVKAIAARPKFRRKRTFGRLLSGLSMIGVIRSYSPWENAQPAEIFSAGKEPVRGLFGKPRPRWCTVTVPQMGLRWISTDGPRD